MSFELSEGARNSLLTQLQSDLSLGKIQMYDNSAAIPANPGDAVPAGAVLLVEITNNGTATGLTFDAPSGGVMAKAAAETWKGTILATGTVSWYRHVSSTDTGALSTTEIRLQGTVGLIGTDIVVADKNLIISNEQALDYYVVGLPES